MYSNVLASSKFGPIIVNIHDQWIGREILTNGFWSEADIHVIIGIMDGLLKSRDSLVFYDAGANIGTHSLAIAKHFGPRVRVRAFEAQSRIFQMLCGTMALNNLDNVDCHLNAVSNVSGETLMISLPDYTKLNNFGGLELLPIEKSDNQDMRRSGRMQPVTTVKLDDFNETVSFIKLDIEGMEHLAIQGARTAIETHSPVVFCEMKKTDHDFVLAYFKGIGYMALERNDDCLFLPSGMDISGIAGRRLY